MYRTLVEIVRKSLIFTWTKRRLFLLLLLLQLLPPYTSSGYHLSQWGMVNAYILTHTTKGRYAAFFPLFQLLPLVFIFTLVLYGNRFAKAFFLFGAVSFVLMAFLQSISISKQFGLAVCIGNLVTTLAVSGFWFWEALKLRGDFTWHKPPIWKYWALPLALLAFWEPVHPITLLPDFQPFLFLTSGSGLAFCLVTPLYLAVLTLYFPRVHITVPLVTSFVGMMLGLGNLALEFILLPAYWWIGILHVPLLIISCYTFFYLVYHHTNPA